MRKLAHLLYTGYLRLWKWINSGFQRKLMLTYILVIAVPLALSAVLMYKGATNIVTQQTEKNNYKMLQLTNGRIDQFIEEIDRISYFVYLDDVQVMLNQIPKNLAENSSWKSELTSKLNKWIGFLGFNGGIRGVVLANNGGVYFNSENNKLNEARPIEKSMWYKEALQLEGKQVILGPRDIDQFMTISPYRNDSLNFAIARRVHNMNGSQPLGVLFIAVEYYDMNKLLADMDINRDTGLVIVNQSNEILYQRGANVSNEDIDQLMSGLNGGCGGVIQNRKAKVLVNTFQSSVTNWCYVTLTDTDVLHAAGKNLNGIIALCGLLGFVAALLISLVFSRRIVIPLKRLQTSMNNIQKENFRTNIPVDSYDEVGQLTGTFNHMVTRIRELIRTVYHAQIKEKEANLSALQAQINPHFLYNTLDTINAMAVTEEKEQISQMVVALGEMFKYAISQKDRPVTIQDELTHLEYYLTIQNCRHGDRFRCIVHIPGEIRKYSIIRLILQPLVENAIYHGVELIPGEAVIRIVGEWDDESICLSIQDNGMGIQKERLRNIQARLAYDVMDQEDNLAASIGMFNVNERLKLHFGEEYGLMIDSEWGKGTKVTIRIPAVLPAG